MTRARTSVSRPGAAGFPPAPLAAELRSLDRRVLPRDLEDLVVRLCAWAPLPLRELARLLGRDDIYLQNTVIKRLLEDGRLDFLHKGRPNHPRQAYVAGAGRRRAKGAPRRGAPVRAPRRPAPPAKPVPAGAPPPAPLMEMPDIGRND